MNENIELGNITTIQSSPRNDNRSIRLIRRLSAPDIPEASQSKPRTLKKTNSLGESKVSQYHDYNYYWQ